MDLASEAVLDPARQLWRAQRRVLRHLASQEVHHLLAQFVRAAWPALLRHQRAEPTLLEGGLGHHPDGQSVHEFRVGGAWEEHPGEIHTATNLSKTATTRIIAVGIYDKGAPLSTPAP